MAGLFDLDFAPGLQIQRVVEEHFSSPVSFHTSSSREFFLVVTFGRSAIRLNEDSVSLILQSCLGGVAKDFKVAHPSRMCFRFLVFSKSVGFLVYNLKFYKCSKFAGFFDLWGDGGPNWIREHHCWLEESQASWTYVGSKSKPSYVDVVKQCLPDRSKPSVFSRLDFSKVPDPNLASIRAKSAAQSLALNQWRGFRSPPNQPAKHASNFKSPQSLGCNRCCFRCLAPGHLVKDCSQQVQCKTCYKYGHVSRTCLSRKLPLSLFG
jgi:hypothetical protein